MTQPINLPEYKQEIADLYSGRSKTYDEGDWHRRIAHRLVEYAEIKPGQQVLDIATGTGMVAIEAAQIVGSQGRVVGVDISPGMLEQAKQKIEALNLNNLEFILADAETLDFTANSFDVILCSSALIWMADIPSALRLWYQLLKPGGLIGFHAFAETAFVGGVVVQEIAEKYGVTLAFSKPTGTMAKCHELLVTAGFDTIEIRSEQDGSSYITLEQAQRMWTGGSHPTPGQFPNPLSKLSSEQIEAIKKEFDAELTALATDQGIWNDITIFYVFGRKAG